MVIQFTPTIHRSNAKATLYKRVVRFLKLHDMKPSTFGRKAVKDPSLVLDLERGRSVGIDTAEKIQSFMKGFAK